MIRERGSAQATGDLPPTGWREGESSGQASPSPASMCLSGLALPARPGRRSVGRFRASKAGVALLEPRSRVRPAPHPVAASSLWVALWRESAVVPTACGSQPGGVPGWGQVLRRSAPALPDVQQHTVPRCGRIDASLRGCRLYTGVQFHPPARDASGIRPPGAFRFVLAKTVAAIIAARARSLVPVCHLIGNRL